MSDRKLHTYELICRLCRPRGRLPVHLVRIPRALPRCLAAAVETDSPGTHVRTSARLS